MNWLENLPWGSIITATVTVTLAALASWSTYLVFRTKTETGLTAIDEKIADTNRRVSDLAAGVSQIKTELLEFRQHVERHYVEKDEIAELKLSFERSIDRMQQSLDIATATMGDVRDAVLVLTAKGNKPSVPPARRRATTKQVP
ncbi:hypothetical protein [Devosia faecipullorum]|uniref:hypothetical protein n=1 Tax=Devosia faecipullorum TaxID=2755039 RepID=UPI00187B91C0|nr:hypothetical protein [Devosia faecipullorum]MBE7732190.1 hypothetical protein [Devosia faecipullorum]